MRHGVAIRPKDLDMDKKSGKHNEKIIEQFSKQAVPFSKVPGHKDSMQVLISMAGVQCSDRVLDVACGPGLVACEFAKIANQVVGIDITAKMIERAKVLQREQHITNVQWQIDAIPPLPFPDASFSIVITRYSFHHFIQPGEVLNEMIRVCRPGGRVLVADVALPSNKTKAYDDLEKLRDPSHTHAMSISEWEELFSSNKLTDVQKDFYSVPIELERQMKASFPNPGDEEKVRARIKEDIGIDRLGIGAFSKGDEIHYSVPIGVFVGRRH